MDEPVLSEANPGGEATDSHSFERQEFEIRWEPDLPVRAAEPAVLRARRGTDLFEVGIEEWKEPAPPAQDAPGTPVIEVVEAAQPIHANLIEFPRELVATRKIRPRLAEGPFASAPAPGSQLSIFEVDPSAISIEPAEAGVVDEASAPVWTAPEWSGIELDEQPQRESVDESPRKPQEKPAAQAAAAPELELAPLSQRLMAAVVNGALVMGAILGAAVVAAANVKDLPPLREIELGSVVALVVAGLLYQMLFSTLASGTPGMKYARISLCTFDGLIPTRAQRCRRLGALLLSLLPVGLGVVWTIFDEDRLSWHDRLSGTYLRKD